MLPLLLFACAPHPPVSEAATAAWPSVHIEGAPFIQQEPDFCGEACLAMELGRRGMEISQDQVFDLTEVDPLLGRGAWTRELKVAAEALGLEPGEVWTRGKEGDSQAVEAAWSALHTDLVAGIPSIVCMHFDERPGASEHFRLVLGYDADTDELRFHDPALPDGADQRMDRATFLRLWPLTGADGQWALIRLRMAGAPQVPPGGGQRAALAQQVRLARGLIGEEAFTIALSPPWVVLGDGVPEAVQDRATGTVTWVDEQLRADFFPTPLPETWTIWLFKDDKSYRDHAARFFGDAPDTPYGYADGTERALVMNIGTGGGTLVHEMVHPYVEANLPGAPPWFNEGLASLFEHVGNEGGHIHGYTNWRLDGLQEMIGEGGVPSFRWLTGLGNHAFYNECGGACYAQSRYLFQYLQERGLLRRYVAEYTAHRPEDPTGYDSLLRVLEIEDMEAFTTQWSAWAMELVR